HSLTSLAATVAAAAVILPAALADGGPAPGFQSGGQGIAAPGGRIHYVTVFGRDQTIVEAITAHGSVVQSNWLPGTYGIPYVANDGTLGGLTRDGRRLVLASYAGVDKVTRFAVL